MKRGEANEKKEYLEKSCFLFVDFIDLTPYLTEEYMPNLTKILEENPSIKSAITMSDGGIYGLPAGEQMGTAGIGVEDDYSIYTIPQFSMINKAWLDEHGL